MKHKIKPLRTTILGGIVFLIPLTLVIVALTKGLMVTTKLAKPLADFMPVDSVGGITLVSVWALLLLFLICYLAGLLARMAFARKMANRIESKIQIFFPRYTAIREMTKGLRGDAQINRMKPVLAQFDDQAQIAFEVERGEDGLVALFVPGSPDPWAGVVVHMTPDRIKPLDVSFENVIHGMKRMGYGTSSMIDGTWTEQKELEED